jgi:hypothetical protein
LNSDPETPLEKRNRLYTYAQSLSGISIALIVLGCTLPCCVILIGTWLSNP